MKTCTTYNYKIIFSNIRMLLNWSKLEANGLAVKKGISATLGFFEFYHWIYPFVESQTVVRLASILHLLGPFALVCITSWHFWHIFEPFYSCFTDKDLHFIKESEPLVRISLTNAESNSALRRISLYIFSNNYIRHANCLAKL